MASDAHIHPPCWENVLGSRVFLGMKGLPVKRDSSSSISAGSQNPATFVIGAGKGFGGAALLKAKSPDARDEQTGAVLSQGKVRKGSAGMQHPHTHTPPPSKGTKTPWVCPHPADFPPASISLHSLFGAQRRTKDFDHLRETKKSKTSAKRWRFSKLAAVAEKIVAGGKPAAGFILLGTGFRLKARLPSSLSSSFPTPKFGVWPGKAQFDHAAVSRMGSPMRPGDAEPHPGAGKYALEASLFLRDLFTMPCLLTSPGLRFVLA